jgi:hypothetical protein
MMALCRAPGEVMVTIVMAMVHYMPVPWFLVIYYRRANRHEADHGSDGDRAHYIPLQLTGSSVFLPRYVSICFRQYTPPFWSDYNSRSITGCAKPPALLH